MNVPPNRTKIVATIGPACGSRPMIRRMMKAGMNVCRINFSHGDENQRADFLANIRAVEADLGRPVAVCADLCGPKIRVGMMSGGRVELEAGREIVIQREATEGTAERISTTLPELVDVVVPGETILLADGRLRFEVVRTAPPDEFTCRVVTGGPLSSGKGVNLPDTSLLLSPLTEKDQRDIDWIAAHDFDYVALSFVQRADDVQELRGLLEERGCGAHIIAKIEKPQALKDIDRIVAVADAVMVARGDLGVEMDFPKVPIAQKSIVEKCEVAGKPCIIATEMLESMIESPRPTRAEVSDVANAVFDHADAVMLSAESSIGRHPVAVVEAMRRTLLAAEELQAASARPGRIAVEEPRPTAALAAALRKIVSIQPAAAIALYTASGNTARIVSKNRPGKPILALAGESSVARRTALYFAVVPQVLGCPSGVELFASETGRIARELGLAVTGEELVLLVGNPVGATGETRILGIQTVA